MEAIKIKGLKKLYGKIVGVENVNLSVNKGEIFGFVGPNGAGKSTTIKALLGLIKQNKGEALIMGKNAQINPIEVKRITSYMPSEVAIYPELKVLDILKLSCNLKKEDIKQVYKLAKEFDLSLTKKMGELSLGNKKKVQIVSVLIGNPEVIVLDEPTSGLDPLMQAMLFEKLEEKSKQGVTILFSSHKLDEVQKVCDRVAVIKDGKIIAIEEVSKIKQKALKIVEFTVSRGKVDFTTLKGVKDLKQEGNRYSFTYKGKPKPLIKFLNELNISDVSVENTDLETMFMHYYK